MPFTNFKPLSLGNVNGIPCAWTYDGIRDFAGLERKIVYGRARITDTLQNAIPLVIPSDRKDQTNFPDRPFTLSAGDIITYVGIRLPGNPILGEQDFYGQLPRGATLVGTTGENLKVSPTTGTTHTVTAPVITAANNAYAPDASVQIARVPNAMADQASPGLLTTLAADTTFQITVSNAGNTAAGNGIRVSASGKEAHILVVMCVCSPMKMLRMEELNYPIPPGP